MGDRWYLCIDLKSFYASVECVERGLDPMTTNLVVADPDRSEKTICLAVSPSMKALGVKNRCRVFEIPKSIPYIMAPPRMQKYIDYAAQIYGIYLKYIAPEDIHVYSIDEAFLDVTPYLRTYGKTPKEMAVMLMEEVRQKVGVRATCGIGTNLYLTKIALDITAKHAPDFIGELDEKTYREKLWDHRPLTDFWRIGTATARRLASMGIYTMGQIAHADEEMLYRVFGVDAELMIDHAWGIETTTIADIHAYKPKNTSLTSGQVLMRDYNSVEAREILREMTEQLCLDMVQKKVAASSVTVVIGYSNELAKARREEIRKAGTLSVYDFYRTAVMDRGTVKMDRPTNVIGAVVPKVLALYDRVVDPALPIRRFYVNMNDLTDDDGEEQMTLFSMLEPAGDSGAATGESAGATGYRAPTEAELEADRKVQQAMLDIRAKFGKTTIFKAADLEDGATSLERMRQIGGHKSGE